MPRFSDREIQRETEYLTPQLKLPYFPCLYNRTILLLGSRHFKAILN
jgi:hypothetical protein